MKLKNRIFRHIFPLTDYALDRWYDKVSLECFSDRHTAAANILEDYGAIDLRTLKKIEKKYPC